MNKLKFILKSFNFYKRQHLAVIAGTIISTAILTGALIIGDSVKYSLSRIVEGRLGNIQFVLQSPERFVRAKLAAEISEKLNVKSAPIIIMQGAAVNPEKDTRINKTQVIGIDSSFWLISGKQMPALTDDEVIISKNTAERLNLKINDDIVIRVEKLSVIPVNSPFSTEDVPSVSLRVKIKAVADENNLGRFSLKNNQAAPYNVFMSREYLSSKLEIKGLANIILIAGDGKSNISSELFNNTISDIWQLKDAGIEIKKLDDKGNSEIISDRIFIDKQISSSILKRKLPVKTILTYLVNSIKFKVKSTPYSFVSAVSDNYSEKHIKENEIIINEWLAEDLNAHVSDTIGLKYFVFDAQQNLKEDSSLFVVREIIPTKDSLINRSLMPKFPGFAKAVSCLEWNTSMPIDMKKIRHKDEEYWNEFKGTPKSVISMEAGQKLWQNKFGDYTSIRFNDSIFKNNLEVLKSISPKDLNISVADVKSIGINASQSGVDFGELFLSLSFFVIIAGIILTIMLYVLGLEQRKFEIGLQISMGYTKKDILKLRIYESLITIFIGSILGVLAGILYNYCLLLAINSVWNDIIRTSMMNVYIKPITLFIGAFSGFLISLISICIFTIRNLNKTSIGLMNDNIQPLLSDENRSKRLNNLFMFTCFAISLGLLLFSIITSVDQNAGLFLASGGTFMCACILLTSKLLSRNKNNSSLNGFTALALKNASRNKYRSLTIVVLLSLGVFVVVITGANRQTFYGSENDNKSGTGGYSLWAETSVPLNYNLNTKKGKNKLGIENDSILSDIDFAQFPYLVGDDASCLNLNHVVRPSIIGINPSVFDRRKSFSFENLAANVNQLNPWLELNKSYSKNVIPAFADQTVITWGLLKKIGDTIKYVNEAGKDLNIVIVGGLSSSVFQGNILISEENFRENFPSIRGSKLMLIDASADKTEKVKEHLNRYLKDYGIESVKTTERLSQFNSVENTYLSVFMILGGLGVIIGTFGIGIILFRNMLDRKQETAMLMALGYTKQNIFSIIYKENIFLIMAGMAIGTISSIIGILPSLISVNFSIPDNFVFILVILIFVNALFWIYFPIKKMLKGDIIGALRNE